MLKYLDWRDAPGEMVGRLWDAECARWRDSLNWDYICTARTIEAARDARRLPGLLARGPDGNIVAWAYFLLHDDTLHIGNLVASEPRAASRLLGAILNTAEAHRASQAACFLFPGCAGLDAVLQRFHFAIERHPYLQMTLGSGPPDEGEVALRDDYTERALSDSIPDIAQLLSEAYQGTGFARCFARDGRADQWVSYVAQLVGTRACGRFEPSLSMSMESRTGALAATVLVTAVGEKTAHVAQMAVAPAHRRCGLGAHLVRAACGRARAAGYELMTLVVAESNAGARRLYDRLGFAPRATLLFADRKM